MSSHIIKLLSLLAFLSLSTACISDMPGDDAVEITADKAARKNPDIEISIDDIDRLSSDGFRAFHVSFRNNSDQFKHFENIQIEFPTFEAKPDVLLGKDLSSYLASVEAQHKRDVYNRQLVATSIGVLGLVGGAVAGVNGNEGAEAIGTIAGSSALTYGAVDSFMTNRDYLKFEAALPDNHLLKPFEVAPKMVVSRWIIVRMSRAQRYDEARLVLTEAGNAPRTFKVEESRWGGHPKKQKITH